MNREELRKKWNGMSAEILSDRVEWQAQHPMATFREIEAEVDKRLSELRAQMLSDAAMMSEEERWKVGEKGRYVRVVGRNWRRRGRRSGSCKRGEGRRWNWSGNMQFVRCVGKGFFPLDEALMLLPGILTPHGHERLVRLAGWMPFGKAAEMLEDFWGSLSVRS